MKLPTNVMYWDDERKSGNGIIITLKKGFAFRDANTGNAQHVAGFDTARDARREIAGASACACVDCHA